MGESLSLNEIKDIEMEILRYIDKICSENGISYYLDCGTLLGAVRHCGFIPWDDDIDLIIDRKDYRKLLNLLDNGSERFKVLSMYKFKEYQYLFAKIVDSNTKLVEHNTKGIEEMGVFVDLFPMEHLPNNKIRRRFAQGYVKWLKSIMSLLFNEESGRSRIPNKYRMICLPYRKMGWKGVRQKLDKYLTKLSKNKTDYLINLVASDNMFKDVERSIFEETVDLEFEGEKFKAPKEYKEYLKLLYGDYMTPPPEDKRISNHDFDVYRR